MQRSAGGPVGRGLASAMAWVGRLAGRRKPPRAYLVASPAADARADAFATQLLAGLARRGERVRGVRAKGRQTADRALAGEIRLRTGDAVPIGPDFRVDWETVFASRATSNLLYFYSLEYVASLLAAHEQSGDERFLAAATGIVGSFLDHLDASPANRAAVLALRGRDSNDHATSKRAGVLLQFVETLVRLEREPALARRAAAFLHVHALFLLDDANYVDNNHGVMADLALAELGMALGPGTADGRDFVAKAEGRLRAAVGRIFDADGYAFENTIGYHRFNLNLFRAALDRLAQRDGAGGFAAAAGPVLLRAEEALRYCVWPDGGIPPIGDSQVFRAAAVSIDRPRLFAQSHFAVIKSPELYLSFICGRRGRSHKHVDDTSVTLRFAGRDILVDGGAYNYDPDDPYRQCLSSSFGHCGIFPLQLEGVDRRAYHRLRPAARITEWEEHPGGVRTAGEVRFDAWGIVVRRRIAVAWPGSVTIDDEVVADRGRGPITARQAWLLGKEVAIAGDTRDAAGRTLVLESGDVQASFRLTSAGGTLVESCHRGVLERPYRGWCSEVKGQALPTTELARYQTGERLRFRAEIVLARKFSASPARGDKP